jgi:hypothetical protein
LRLVAVKFMQLQGHRLMRGFVPVVPLFTQSSLVSLNARPTL